MSWRLAFVPLIMFGAIILAVECGEEGRRSLVRDCLKAGGSPEACGRLR